MQCKHCGSHNIEVGISWGISSEINSVGLNFSKGIFGAVAQVYCDLCLDCGEIHRIYVKDKDLADKKWNKK